MTTRRMSIRDNNSHTLQVYAMNGVDCTATGAPGQCTGVPIGSPRLVWQVSKVFHCSLYAFVFSKTKTTDHFISTWVVWEVDVKCFVGFVWNHFHFSPFILIYVIA